MHHTKLIVFSIVLVVVIIFGFIFWDDLKFNQQELSNTPLPPSPLVEDNRQVVPPASQQQSNDNQASLSSDDDFDDLEKDLSQTNLEIDSDSAQLESEMSGL